MKPRSSLILLLAFVLTNVLPVDGSDPAAAATSLADEARAAAPSRLAVFSDSLPIHIKTLLPRSLGGVGCDEESNRLYSYILGIGAGTWCDLSNKGKSRISHIASEERARLHMFDRAVRFARIEDDIAAGLTMSHEEFLSAIIPHLSHDLRVFLPLESSLDDCALGESRFYLALREALPSRVGDALAVDEIKHAIRRCVGFASTRASKMRKMRTPTRVPQNRTRRRNPMGELCHSWHGTATHLLAAMEGHGGAEANDRFRARASTDECAPPVAFHVEEEYEINAVPDAGGLSATLVFQRRSDAGSGGHDAAACTCDAVRAKDAASDTASDAASTSISAVSARGLCAAMLTEDCFPSLKEMVRRNSMSE